MDLTHGTPYHMAVMVRELLYTHLQRTHRESSKITNTPPTADFDLTIDNKRFRFTVQEIRS